MLPGVSKEMRADPRSHSPHDTRGYYECSVQAFFILCLSMLSGWLGALLSSHSSAAVLSALPDRSLLLLVTAVELRLCPLRLLQPPLPSRRLLSDSID